MKNQHEVPGKEPGPNAQRGYLSEVRVCLTSGLCTKHSIPRKQAEFPRAQAISAFLSAEKEALSLSLSIHNRIFCWGTSPSTVPC